MTLFRLVLGDNIFFGHGLSGYVAAGGRTLFGRDGICLLRERPTADMAWCRSMSQGGR